jgi:hypothetical protein
MQYEMTAEEQAKAKQAYAAIRTSFNIYVKTTGFTDIEIHPGLVVCAVSSWILDESRHTDFHPCEGVMRYKRASYFIYWFTYIKPIQITNYELHTDARMALINERFALFMAYRMLGVSASGVVPNSFSDEMLYSLRYRNSNPKALFVTMHLLETSAKCDEFWKAYSKHTAVAC